MIELPPGYTQVSIATLAVAAALREQPQYFAVWHPNDRRKPLQALSFGPKLPLESRQYFIDNFSAHPDGFVENDARLAIPTDRVDALEADIEQDRGFYLADVGGGHYLDWGNGELIERMAEQYWVGLEPPLSADEASYIEVVDWRLVRQPVEAAGQGGMGAKVRLFRQVFLRFTYEIAWNSFVAHPAIVFLPKEALLTTNGGRQVGDWKGFKLANNVGVGTGWK